MSCTSIDKPTKFSLTSPLRTASDGRTIIFAQMGQSVTCPFVGASVSLLSLKGHSGDDNLVFMLDTDRTGEKLQLETGTSRLAFFGNGQAVVGGWDPPKGRITIAAVGRGRYFVRAIGARQGELFRGIVVGRGGKIYIRDAMFARAVVAYAGQSEHSCEKVSTIEEASAALARAEAGFPSP